MGLYAPLKVIMTGAIWLLLVVSVMGAPATMDVDHIKGCSERRLPTPSMKDYISHNCPITLKNKAIAVNQIKQPYIEDLTIYLHRELIYISLDDLTFSPNLERLNIFVECPFYISPNTFKGLEKFKWLRIYYVNSQSDTNNQITTNQTIIDTSSPSLAPGWLDPISGISDLYLHHFDATIFPTMQFCHLLQLKTLVLQNIRMNTTAGLGQICDSSQEYCIPCLPKVTLLKIMMNPITSLSVNFSKNLPSLQKLDMGSCSLSSFHLDDMCKDSRDIKKIDMNRNKLTALEVRYLDQCDCPQLQILSLHNNQLQDIAPDLFLCTRHMKNLNLANNSLSQNILMKAGLNTLIELVKLDLSHNNIKTLHSSLIGNMTELKYFVCSDCGLTRIENDTFNHSKKIAILQLDRNDLHVVGSGVFASLVNLKKLDLSKNYLKATEFITGLHTLKELNLEENLVTEIPDFTGSWVRLTTLVLDKNSIAEVTPHHLSGLISLKKLSLGFNHIQTVHLYSETLEELYLNDNQIKEFDLMYIPRLIHLKLDNNLIASINRFEAYNSGNLKILNLSRNEIKSISIDSLNQKLESIDLSWNYISKIGHEFISKFSSLQVLNLTYNNLTVLKPLDGFTTSLIPRPEVYLQGNPVHCDCHSEWLFYTKRDKIDLPRVPDFYQLQCASSTIGRNLSFSAIRPSDFVCQYTSSCFPECICYYNDISNTNYMNCSSRNMASLPHSGPMDTRIITLDQNNLTSLNSSSLNFPLLEGLSIYNSHISEIETGAFSNLIMLRVLDLHQNDIETIGIDTFANLSSLERLYLNGNRIHYIENGSFDDLLQLKILRLHGNKLKYLDFTLFERMYSLAGLTLYDNPWICDCQFGPQFKKWLTYSNMSKIIIDDKLISCNVIVPTVTPDSAQYILRNTTMIKTSPHYQALLDSDFPHCSNPQFLEPVKHAKSITEVVSLTAVFVVLVIFTLTIYKNLLLLRVWFYNKCGVRIHEEEEDNGDKPYDLFIAYAKTDERLVVRELLPELERADMSYKVCLECRDWPPAAATTEMIISSVQKSKRTIVLVSPNHLDTQWCEYSFDAAHYQVLTDKQIRLILVLTDIELQSRMTRAMKLYMKTNTFLVIGEKWFWKKLRYYLSDHPRGADHVVDRDFDLLEVY